MKQTEITILLLINKTGISFLHPKSTKINTNRIKHPLLQPRKWLENLKRASVEGPILLPENKDLQGRPGLETFSGFDESETIEEEYVCDVKKLVSDDLVAQWQYRR
ncbi:hypothetical protein CDAR_451161 [Caerostris darwini]|uniref:Uncharacterized protein n=1 Tax=Caerostris darwini TaxID=1538125 RepID=A0AAV4PSI0_9ARAC|nr:hypothetical protein CDAR_451161 [Caerostris darwini]